LNQTPVLVTTEANSALKIGYIFVPMEKPESVT
jgi:hypothetical protein